MTNMMDVAKRSRSIMGFTLIELMIVIVVLGMLIAVGLPRFTTFLEEGRTSASRQEMEAIVSASQLYHLNMREHPRSVRDLVEEPAWLDEARGGEQAAEIRRRNIRWQGPYMDGSYNDIGCDSWGNPYGIFYNIDEANNNCGIIVVSGGWLEVPVWDVDSYNGGVGDAGDAAIDFDGDPDCWDSDGTPLIIFEYIRYDGQENRSHREASRDDDGLSYGGAYMTIDMSFLDAGGD